MKKYQKRLILSVSFVFVLLDSSGQGGFNLRIVVDDRTQLQSVNCTIDSTFITAGYTADSETGDHLDFVMLEFDMQGNLLNEATIETPGCFTNIYEEGDSYAVGLYIQHEQAIFENVYAHRLFWYNNELDTLFTKIVQSPYKDSLWDDAEFMYSQYAVLAPDSSLFYSFGVWKPETTGNDVCIKKYSPNGEELWTYIYESDAEVDVCYSILPQPGGGGVFAIAQGIWEENDYMYTRFTKVDESGNEEWIIDSRTIIPNSVFQAESIVQDDNNLICAGAFKPVGVITYGLSKIIKFSFDGELLWQREYGDYQTWDVEGEYITNIVQTCDSNYVAGGTWYSYPGSEEIIEGQNNPDIDSFANIVKFERNTGDILWERKYRFLQVYRDRHTLVDMKATPDGGVIFCGEARDPYHVLDPPYQQGWLVKLDECGCLVPGCDTLCKYVCNVPTDTTDSTFFPVFNSHFIIGPNPANDFINIYFGPSPTLPQGKGVVFEIHDVQGKLVYSFVPTTTEITYMMSTEILAAGMYVISLRDGDEVVEQKKVIVEK